MLLQLEMVDLRLSPSSDTPPSPHEADLSEKCRLDRHGVEARHIHLGICTLDVKVIGLEDHLSRIAQSVQYVQ